MCQHTVQTRKHDRNTDKQKRFEPPNVILDNLADNEQDQNFHDRLNGGGIHEPSLQGEYFEDRQDQDQSQDQSAAKKDQGSETVCLHLGFMEHGIGRQFFPEPFPRGLSLLFLHTLFFHSIVRISEKPVTSKISMIASFT